MSVSVWGSSVRCCICFLGTMSHVSLRKQVTIENVMKLDLNVFAVVCLFAFMMRKVAIEKRNKYPLL